MAAQTSWFLSEIVIDYQKPTCTACVHVAATKTEIRHVTNYNRIMINIPECKNNHKNVSSAKHAT